MAGLLRDRKGKAALIALILGVLTLSLAPTVAQRGGGWSLAGYAGLRPDWVRLSSTPAPSPSVIELTPATPEVSLAAPASPEPTPFVETAPTPTIEAPLPAPTETIVIAAVSPPAQAPPTATATAAPTESPAPPPVDSPSPPAAPVVTEGLDLAFAEAVVELTNEHRIAHGLSPLAEHPALVAAALGYADLHAHVSPDRLDHGLNGSTLASRAEAEGYTGWTFLAENLVWATFEPAFSPAQAVQQWLDSPAHRDNMLNPTVNEIGVGCYVSQAQRPFLICVQDFGARP